MADEQRLELKPLNAPVVEVCDHRRGGKRSKVLCEWPLWHEGDHGGRGRDGRWFFWPNKETPGA